MNKNYGGVIWTNHALKRMSERGVKQGDAWATFRRPDSSRKAQKKGSFVYYKTYGNQKIEVVAAKNNKKEWVIMSVWSKEASKPIKKEKTSLNRILKLVTGK